MSTQFTHRITRTAARLLFLAVASGSLITMAASSALAGRANEEIVVQPNQIVVQVKGVVCSFCAYGAEKNLAKLSFLDRSQFGDGVLIDIFNHRITLALADGEMPDLKAVDKAIKKGGYDPLVVHFRLSGTVEKHGQEYTLTDGSCGKTFALEGDGVAPLVGRGPVEIQVHLDAAQMPKVNAMKTIPVLFDKELS